MQHYNVKDLCSPHRETVEQTFNLIYDEYSYLVFYVALTILHRNEDAKDVMNETFLKMYEKRDTLKNGKSLKYYLVTIAKNLALNEQKRIARYVPYNAALDRGDEEKEDDFATYIQKFSDFLDQDEVTLIVYRFLYEYTFKEIARLQKKTINSVSSKYKRTMDKIRKHYGKD